MTVGNRDYQSSPALVLTRILNSPLAEEPREAPKRSVDMFLDLAATEEDHAQVSLRQ
jgi:hypothetical protein